MEHVCLLKAKQDLSQEEENGMLDYLYTTQYQMGGVVATSLGTWLNNQIHTLLFASLGLVFKVSCQVFS